MHDFKINWFHSVGNKYGNSLTIVIKFVIIFNVICLWRTTHINSEYVHITVFDMQNIAQFVWSICLLDQQEHPASIDILTSDELLNTYIYQNLTMTSGKVTNSTSALSPALHMGALTACLLWVPLCTGQDKQHVCSECRSAQGRTNSMSALSLALHRAGYTARLLWVPLCTGQDKQHVCSKSRSAQGKTHSTSALSPALHRANNMIVLLYWLCFDLHD